MINLPLESKWITRDFRKQMDRSKNNTQINMRFQRCYSFLPFENITTFIKNIIHNETVFAKDFSKLMWLRKLLDNNIIILLIWPSWNVQIFKNDKLLF